MRQFKYILAFLFFAVIGFAWTNSFSFSKQKSTKLHCGFFINKRTADLFQVRSSLKLNCDSTFQYITTSCLLNNKSEGIWSVRNDSLFLYTSKNIIKLVKKEERKKIIFRKYADLTGQTLLIHDSLLIWQHSAKYIDTFSRSYPGQYALKD